MENFINRASTAISGAFREAVCIADDMHAIIVADEDDPIKVKRNRSSVASVKPMKETSTTSACEARDDETNVKQPTSTSPIKEVEGSPATLAKLITKLDKKEMQIARIKQQISETEEEVADTRKSIKAIVTFGNVLYKDKDRSDKVDGLLHNEEVDGDDKALALDNTSTYHDDTSRRQ